MSEEEPKTSIPISSGAILTGAAGLSGIAAVFNVDKLAGLYREFGPLPTVIALVFVSLGGLIFMLARFFGPRIAKLFDKQGSLVDVLNELLPSMVHDVRDIKQTQGVHSSRLEANSEVLHEIRRAVVCTERPTV